MKGLMATMISLYTAPGITQRSRENTIKTGLLQSTPNKIINAVCKDYGVQPEQIKMANKKRANAEPRQICMYLLRQHSNLTTVKIGEMFNRDHTNVSYSANVVKEIVSVDKDFKRRLERITNNIFG